MKSGIAIKVVDALRPVPPSTATHATRLAIGRGGEAAHCGQSAAQDRWPGAPTMWLVVHGRDCAWC